MNLTIKAGAPGAPDVEVEAIGGEVKVYVRQPGTTYAARYSNGTNVARVERAVEELRQALAVIEHGFGIVSAQPSDPKLFTTDLGSHVVSTVRTPPGCYPTEVETMVFKKDPDSLSGDIDYIDLDMARCSFDKAQAQHDAMVAKWREKLAEGRAA